MKGHVLKNFYHACRNTLQFFTIPIGLFLGGFLVDRFAEPLMARIEDPPLWTVLFGSGKGSGAALMMFILGVAGVILCLVNGLRLKKFRYTEN